MSIVVGVCGTSLRLQVSTLVSLSLILFDAYIHMPPELQWDWIKPISGASFSAFAFCVMYGCRRSWRPAATGIPELWQKIEQYVDADGRVSLNGYLLKYLSLGPAGSYSLYNK